jgi:hypothetical protein
VRCFISKLHPANAEAFERTLPTVEVVSGEANVSEDWVARALREVMRRDLITECSWFELWRKLIRFLEEKIEQGEFYSPPPLGGRQRPVREKIVPTLDLFTGLEMEYDHSNDGE